VVKTTRPAHRHGEHPVYAPAAALSVSSIAGACGPCVDRLSCARLLARHG